MKLKKLLSLFPAPKQSQDSGTAAGWHAAEKRFGLSFPEDYKDFVSTYGTGLFGGYIRVFTPFSHSILLSLEDNVAGDESSCREYFNSDGTYNKSFPYPFYPVSPGLLVWGSDIDGNKYYWLTKGLPNRWPVVYQPVRTYEYLLLDIGMTDFLCALIENKLGRKMKKHCDTFHRKAKEEGRTMISIRREFVTPLEFVTATPRGKERFRKQLQNA